MSGHPRGHPRGSRGGRGRGDNHPGRGCGENHPGRGQTHDRSESPGPRRGQGRPPQRSGHTSASKRPRIDDTDSSEMRY